MENIFIEVLPPWVETGLQPAFYDKESGTVLQQTARMYAKVIELIKSQNKVLQDFTTLYNYVHDYFDNLDVQEEINNKLDAMTEDGTMAEIINQEIFGELNEAINDIQTDITDNIKPSIQTNTDDITAIQTDIDENIKPDIADNTKNINDLKLKELRAKEYNRYHTLSLPQMNSFFNNFQILESNEKKNYAISYNLNNFKNSGASVAYIDPSASNDSSAGTEADPDYNFYRAMNHVSSTGTVILKEGVYRRRNFKMVENTASWLKSVNFTTQGKVLLTNSDELSWSQNESYSNVYQATRTNVANVIDIRGWKDDIFCRLTNVGSLSSCANTIGSYYYNNNIVYVNLGEAVTNSKVVVNLQTQNTPLNFSSSGEARKWYIENVTCLGGDRHVIGVMSQTGTKGTFTAKNCKFYYTTDTGENGNGLCLYGVNSLLIDCDSSFNMSDGFSYKAYSGFTPYGVEINCKASSNGVNNSQTTTSNGSTAHGGAQVIRFNCTYFNNRGGNVADVDSNTLSINIKCNAFDSIVGTHNVYDADFVAQQAGTTMYLYNCYSRGYSWKNIIATADTTIYISNCEYDTTGGEGNIIIE